MRGKNILDRPWLFPVLIIVGMLALLLSFLQIAPSEFRYLFGAEKFLSDSAAWYYAVFSLVFAAFFFLSAKFGSRSINPDEEQIPKRKIIDAAIFVSFAVFAIGHLSLFYAGRSLFSGFGDLISAKAELNMAGSGTPIVFITITPVFCCLLAYRFFPGNRLPVPLLIKLIAVISFGVLLLRSLVFERLALFELLVPFAWFYLKRLHTARIVITVSAAFVAGCCVFACAEYFRSWPSYVQAGVYQNTPGDFITFNFYRIIGYYITPINHINALWNQGFLGSTEGYYTFRFFTNSPVIGGFLVDGLGIFPNTATHANFWVSFLVPAYGLNPEYNLFGAPGVALLDWSYGGIGVAMVFGFLGGKLWGLSRAHYTLGVLGFPIFLVGLAELPRLLYWTNERLLLSVFFLLVLSVYSRKLTMAKLTADI